MKFADINGAVIPVTGKGGKTINTDKKVYYSVCCTIAVLLAIVMIYRSIPHKSGDEKTVKERLIPEDISITEIAEPENTVSEQTSAVTNGNQTNSEADASSSESSEDENGLVNINTADLKTLMTLKGIGEKKAQNIIDHRTQNGSFTSIDALADVPGIGKKTIESLRAFITV